MNRFFIEVKQIATAEPGMIAQKGKTLSFNSEEEARTFAKENIEGSRRILWWQAIDEKTVKNKGYEIIE